MLTRMQARTFEPSLSTPARILAQLRADARWQSRDAMVCPRAAGPRVLAIYNKASAHKGGFDHAPWSKIAVEVGHSNPPCKPWIVELQKYVLSGPSNGELIKSLRMAQKAFVTTTANSEMCMIGQEFMQTINECAQRFGPGEMYPYTMNAFILANMIGGKVVDGIYKTFKKENITYILNKKIRGEVKIAEQFMEHTRVLLSKMKMDKVDLFKLTTRSDVRCVYVLTKKKHSMDENFTSIDEVIKVHLLNTSDGRAPARPSCRRCFAKGALQRVLRLAARPSSRRSSSSP